LSTTVLEGLAVVAVACSGGRDSLALLHATASAARDVPGLAVVALHVHHGLSVHADAWQAHVEHCCAAWAKRGLPVRCMVRRVQCADDGRGVEAAARAARYDALREMAQEAGSERVLLAHHRRDQAETVLLQALRGGSAAGLAAMPREAWRDGICWIRPWLGHPRQAIDAYIAAHGLGPVEDDSNDSPAFARNRLRLAVWPALTQAFPEAEAALAASARRLADAQAVVDQVVTGALSGLTDDRGSLDAAGWARLDAPMRRLMLVKWSQRAGGAGWSSSWVERLADEVPALLARQQPARWAALGVSLYRGRLQFNAPGGGQPAPAVPLPLACPAEVVTLSMPPDGTLRLPAWRGALRAEPVSAQGVPWSALQGMRVGARAGGEQFQAGPGRPARSLKKQYQQAGVPAWRRAGPLCWQADTLLFAPGLGMDARHWAAEGVPQWGLHWVPDGPEYGTDTGLPPVLVPR
jgi:tRNA(Ile)-lysidine synthase